MRQGSAAGAVHPSAGARGARLCYKEIARLNLSLHTVETHRTAELVLSAVRRGMVT